MVECNQWLSVFNDCMSMVERFSGCMSMVECKQRLNATSG